VAIAIIMETCGLFTYIPAILNEYRTVELSVRTSCLKALTVFKYVSPQSAYYCDSVMTMLEDALTDHDLVHHQTTSMIMKHLALDIASLGCKNYVAFDEPGVAKLLQLQDLTPHYWSGHGCH
jgi:splicing factor 3B subunit 1